MGPKSDEFRFFVAWNDTFLISPHPNSPPLEKIAFRPIESSSRHPQIYFEPKLFGVGLKLSFQWALKVTHFTFWKSGMTPF